MSTEAASLPNDVALCHAMLRQQATAIEQLQRKLEQTEHHLAQLLKQRFGLR